MKNLSEITFKEYFEASETLKDYLITCFDLAYIEPVNVFNVKQTIDLEFVQVKELLKIESFDDLQTIEYVKNLTNISDIELSNISLLKYKQFVKYLTNEAEKIRTLELELQYEPTGKEVAAGINNFSKFDYYPELRELSLVAPNIVDLDKIEINKKREYHKCFAELLYLKEFKEYNLRLNK